MEEGKLVGPGGLASSGAGDYAAKSQDIQTNKDNRITRVLGWNLTYNMVRNITRRLMAGARFLSFDDRFGKLALMNG